MTLFTGSSRVAEKLTDDLKGRIKLEDAGFDWKVLGPDVQEVISNQYFTSNLDSRPLPVYLFYLVSDMVGRLRCLRL